VSLTRSPAGYELRMAATAGAFHQEGER
jgi:hypothetical protein